jgi:group I intron endonuclease
MIGIYKIQNKKDNKLYIGYSSDIKKRFTVHKCYLKKGLHENSYLQRAWNKYGEENFLFEIIELCKLDNCIELEDSYVKLFKSNNRRYGYNLAITGVGSIGKMPKYIIEKAQKTKKINALKRGYYFTPETIKKQADGRRGFKHTAEAKLKIKAASTGRKKTKDVTQKTIDAIVVPVEQYTLENIYVQSFKSIKEALVFLNKDPKSGHISACCKNKRKTAYGYKWKFKKSNS